MRNKSTKTQFTDEKRPIRVEFIGESQLFPKICQGFLKKKKLLFQKSQFDIVNVGGKITKFVFCQTLVIILDKNIFSKAFR